MRKANEIAPGKYRHSKSGKFYEVIGIAKHSETLEEFVVYRALYSSPEFGAQALWIRPKSMFIGKVNLNGKEVPRFELVEKEQN